MPLATGLIDGTATQRNAINALDEDKLLKGVKGTGWTPFTGELAKDNRKEYLRLVDDLKMTLKRKGDYFTTILDTDVIDEDQTTPIQYVKEANDLVFDLVYRLVKRDSRAYELIEPFIATTDGRRAILTLDKTFDPVSTMNTTQFRNLIMTSVVKGREDPFKTLKTIRDAGKALNRVYTYPMQLRVKDLVQAVAMNEHYVSLVKQIDDHEENNEEMFTIEDVMERILSHHTKFVAKGDPIPKVAAVRFADDSGSGGGGSTVRDRYDALQEQLNKIEAAIAAVTVKGGKGSNRDKGKGRGKGGDKGGKNALRTPAKFPCKICRGTGLGTNEVHYPSDCPVVNAGKTAMNITINSNGSSQSNNNANAGAVGVAVNEDGDNHSLSDEDIFCPMVRTSMDADWSDMISDSESSIPDLVSDSDTDDSVDAEGSASDWDEEPYSMVPLVKSEIAANHDRCYADVSSDSDGSIPDLVSASDTDDNCDSDEHSQDSSSDLDPDDWHIDDDTVPSGDSKKESDESSAAQFSLMEDVRTWWWPDCFRHNALVMILLTSLMVILAGVIVCVSKGGTGGWMSTVSSSGTSDSELDVSYRLMTRNPPGTSCENVYALSAKVLEEVYPKMTWMVDSGASYHLCNNKDWFSTLDEDASVRTFNVAHSSQLTTKGLGCIDIPLRDSMTGKVEIQNISKVYYAPDQPFNLLSVARLIQYNGFDNPDFVGNKLQRGKYIYDMTLRGGTYTLNSTSVQDTMAPVETLGTNVTSKRDPT